MAQQKQKNSAYLFFPTLIPDIFSYFGGAYIPVLRETPSDRSKYVIIGLFVFNTATLAFVTMSFALYSVFRDINDDKFIYLVAGFWAILIFSIDWGLVKTMRKVPHVSWLDFSTYTNLVIPTLLRILVATIISFTISKPFEVKIFEHRLGPKIIELKRQYIANERNKLDSLERANNPLGQLIVSKEANAKTMNSLPENVKQFDSQIDAKNKDVSSLRADLSRLYNQKESLWTRHATKYCVRYDSLKNCLDYKWRCENPQYLRVLAEIAGINARIGNLNNDISDIRNVRDDSYQQHLKSFEVIDRALNQQVTTESEKYEIRAQSRRSQDSILAVRADSAYQPNYLIAQIEALELLAADEEQGGSIFWTKWLIFSIILLIDLMPIFIKLLSPYGPYERAMDDLYAQVLSESKLRKFSQLEEYRQNRGLIRVNAKSEREVIVKALEHKKNAKTRKMERDPNAYKKILNDED